MVVKGLQSPAHSASKRCSIKQPHAQQVTFPVLFLLEILEKCTLFSFWLGNKG